MRNVVVFVVFCIHINIKTDKKKKITFHWTFYYKDHPSITPAKFSFIQISSNQKEIHRLFPKNFSSIK